jgi:membrane-associated phospholipid phosphatase
MIGKTALLAVTVGLCLSAQTEPKAGGWKTWIIPSGDAYRLPPPPDEAITAAELKWVKDCAATRDAAALARIQFWDAGPPGYRWMQLAQQMVVDNGLATPLQTRALALVAAAIYDATIAAWDSKYAYHRQHPPELDANIAAVVKPTAAPSYPSEHAAAAGAAASVLAYLFEDQANRIVDLADQAAHSRVVAGAAFPSDVIAGLDLGHQVGRAVIEYAKADKSAQPAALSYPSSEGVWGSDKPVAPSAGQWWPWVLGAANELRPPAPPPFGSAEARAQYDAVKNLQKTNATNRLAWFWQPGFFQPWLQQVETEIFQNHLDSNPPRAARVYALQAIAQHDATLACWDAKFTYLELRPSQVDSTITPLFSLPQHPGFPSGHACAAGASGSVLAYLFPNDAPALTRMAEEAGTSTFDALIHTPLDVSEGLKLGQRVAQKVIQRAETDGSE